MQTLLKLFIFLINIDQETVFNFFGIQTSDAFLDLNEKSAVVSTEISIETLKIVFQNLFDQYQGGLGLIEIENLLLFITFIRFIILANRYNIKTSFYISSVSLIAGFLWYSHLKDVGTWYGDLMSYNRLANRFTEEMLTEGYIEEGKRQSQMYLEFINKSPLQFLKSSLVHSIETKGYRIDPISMLVTNVPETYKDSVTKWYYYLYNTAIPTTWNFIAVQIKRLGSIVIYVYIVRINKKYCPYLIRWHWTYIIVSTVFETEVIRVLYRLYSYDNFILVPAQRFYESSFYQPIFISIITAHYFLVFLGMLHAVCGQYFYFPFIVENTEIHIGKRPSGSIYSGGYTSWQEGGAKQIEIMSKTNQRFAIPRVWWGWFGKRPYISNMKEAEYRKRQQLRSRKKRFKGIKKLIQKLKIWFNI
jgi:hypothetical protein